MTGERPAPARPSPERPAGPGLRSIRFRIVALSASAIVALLLAQGFLVWQQQGVSRSLELVTDGYWPLAKVVARLDQNRQFVDNDVARLLNDDRRPGTGTAATATIYTDKLAKTLEQGHDYVGRARKLTDSPDEQAVLNKIDGQIDKIDQLFQDYQQRSREVVALAEAGNKDEAREKAKPLGQDAAQLEDEIDKLERQVDGRLTNLTKATNQAQARAYSVAVLLTAAALALATALVVAVLYALRPIGVLTEQVQRVARGEWGGDVEVAGGDEVAILAAEFNTMVRALQARDRALLDRAEQLNRLSRYLGSVLDSLEDALVVVEDGRVTLTNPAATRVWGARQGEPLPAVLVPGLVDGPGATLHEVRVGPFGDAGQIVVSADVTEPTRTRERLARSERLALVGQMLAQITHEVRNPLNALSLNAELLAEELGELDPERKAEAWDILGTVATEINRLTAVTAHYLQLARRPKAMLAPEDLPTVVEDVVRLLEPELAQKGVALDLRLERLPAQPVDANQLKQAVLNVVRNAVEAGARRLEISLARDGDDVRIAIRDDGQGMTPEEAGRAGEPFFSTKAKGTGLGLAITRQILEDHDGLLQVTSAPGQGTTVTMVLPDRAAVAVA